MAAGEFMVKYPTRRRMANILKRIITAEGLVQEGTLVDSVRINAKVPALGNLEIEIIAMYYFIFLNNGATLWNGGEIPPFYLVAQFQEQMDSQGITAEIYDQYTEWLTKKYPLLQVARILESNRSIKYSFYPLDPPATFTPGYPLTV
jgi:hypothetical protein